MGFPCLRIHAKPVLLFPSKESVKQEALYSKNQGIVGGMEILQVHGAAGKGGDVELEGAVPFYLSGVLLHHGAVVFHHPPAKAIPQAPPALHMGIVHKDLGFVHGKEILRCKQVGPLFFSSMDMEGNPFHHVLCAAHDGTAGACLVNVPAGNFMKTMVPPKWHGAVFIGRRLIHEAEGAVHAQGFKDFLPKNGFPLLSGHRLHNTADGGVHDITVLGQGAEGRVGLQILQPLQVIHPGNGIIRPGPVVAAHPRPVAEHITESHLGRRRCIPEGEAGNVGSDGRINVQQPLLRQPHHRQGGHGLAAGTDAADGVRKERAARSVPDAKTFHMHLSPVNDAHGHAGNRIIIHHLPDEAGKFFIINGHRWHLLVKKVLRIRPAAILLSPRLRGGKGTRFVGEC